MFAKAFAVTGLVSVASAHILMTNPVPFSGTTQNPLDASGSNFPCQAVSYGSDVPDANNYRQGETKELSFKGTAVHGGGSCQISITTDENPTANSAWKVIKSIEGGCPAQGAAGNIGNDANAPVPFTYPFTIPTDMPAGKYVFAWTWFNKIGNREMYMNCAPINVQGTSGNPNFLDSLPDMFVANTGDGCATSEGSDLQFPNPGDNVVKMNIGTTVFAGPVGSCATGSPGGGSGGSPARPSAEPQPTTSAQATANPQPTAPGGVFITVAPSAGPTSSAAPAPTSTPNEPAVQPPVVENPQEGPANGSPVESEPAAPVETETPAVDAPTGSQAPGAACSPEGVWNCVGGAAFQRCASGVWSSPQQLSAGTSCTGGISTTLNFVKRTGGFTHRASRHRALHRAMRSKN